ncbi:hypothetical protein ACVWWO_007565 [Bradyrhizobium sp. F1.13.1]
MTDIIRPYNFDNVVYTQVNKSLSDDPYYFFSIGATFATPGSFNAATAVSPGSGAPQPLLLFDRPRLTSARSRSRRSRRCTTSMAAAPTQ